MSSVKAPKSEQKLGYLAYTGHPGIFQMHFLMLLYINLYLPTSGSKEKNIQTYKYGEKATKEKKQPDLYG